MKYVIILFMVLFPLTSNASIFYVRDKGGTKVQCTGTTNAVYPGVGTGQACALSNPMLVAGAGCSDGFGNQIGCTVAALWTTGDTLNINGDSDLNPGQQAQYPIGYDSTGVITPSNSGNCGAADPGNCTMSTVPTNGTIQTTPGSTHQAQLWAREHLQEVIPAMNTGWTINNLEITQHSACIANAGNSGRTVDGFPVSCHTSGNGFSPPYGNWGVYGVVIGGTGTLSNNFIHGIGNWGVITTNLTNYTESGNTISGNGGGGVGLGQVISNGGGGTVTLAGTTTFSNEKIVYNGCGSHYPLHSSDPFDTLNYHDCEDDSSSSGSILADGIGMEANSGICNNVVVSNSNISYSTKGNIDFLHCNGSGTLSIYRTRLEAGESQQVKANLSLVNIENSQLINDCNYFQGQTFNTSYDPYGNTPPTFGYDFCRAGGTGLALALEPGGTYNIYNTTMFSSGGANIEMTGSGCNGTTHVNVKNDLIVNGLDYTNSYSQNTNSLENDTGACSPITEDYNLMYQGHDPSSCAGTHDICNNPSNAAVTGTFSLSSNSAGGLSYQSVGLGSQFYPNTTGALVNAANGSVTLTGTRNDFNNLARSTNGSIGSYEPSSCVANANTCVGSECCTGSCTSNVCVSSCLANASACTLNTQCCSSLCQSLVCVSCLSNSQSCTSGSQCCSGICTGSSCVPAAVGYQCVIGGNSKVGGKLIL